MGLHNPLARQPDSYHKKREYTFKKTLGEGTFGIVRSATWKAADPHLGVAVKVISKKVLKGHDEIVKGEIDVLIVSKGMRGEAQAVWFRQTWLTVEHCHPPYSSSRYDTIDRAWINRTASSCWTGLRARIR